MLRSDRALQLAVAVCLGWCACNGPVGTNSGPDAGSGSTDAGSPGPDSGGARPDSGTLDAGSFSDAGASDAGTSDGGPGKSAKRGAAYDFADEADLAVVSGGVSWWYDWGATPNASIPTDYLTRYGMVFYPMLWNGNFNASAVESWLQVHPEVGYLLVLNEPNLTSQSNLTPQAAAQLWPQYEAVAAHAGVKLVGPQITWGTMAGYQDPVAWLDAFYAAYQAANGNRAPQIDYLGFHWYDYGLAAQLDRLTKYNKSFWVTEFANWHSQNDGAQIDTLAKQEAQMMDMVNTCETRADVFRYSWFTGRVNPDPHFSSLLGASGQLTGLGQLYLTLPH